MTVETKSAPVSQVSSTQERSDDCSLDRKAWEMAEVLESASRLAESIEASTTDNPAPGGSVSKGLLRYVDRDRMIQSSKPMLLLVSALCIGLFISSILLAL